MSSSRYRSYLRILYGSLINSGLSVSELRGLADELQRGRLSDELSFMLARTADHLAGHEYREIEEPTRLLENLIRSKRISKQVLLSILKSLGGEPLPEKHTVRAILSEFMINSPTSQINKLIEILESRGDDDDFLIGIEKNRK